MSMQRALARLQEDVGEDILPMIIERTLSEMQLRDTQLRNALLTQDLAALADAAHPLKSVALTMGLLDLGEAAERTESCSRAAQLSPSISATQDLLTKLASGEQALRAFTAEADLSTNPDEG